MARTHYEVLMLHPTATTDVINAVYRVLAKQFHPDHAGPGGAEMMARINEAYAILGNEQKRARYDEILAQADVEQPSPTSFSPRPSMPGATNMKYEAGGWTERPPGEPAPTPSPFGDAGPPPANLPVRGSVLSFGRYKGWAISQVAAYDRNYVEWLSRTMAGRQYLSELQPFLRGVRA
jgi:curved DNA-binding protein CbpA